MAKSAGNKQKISKVTPFFKRYAFAILIVAIALSVPITITKAKFTTTSAVATNINVKVNKEIESYLLSSADIQTISERLATYGEKNIKFVKPSEVPSDLVATRVVESTGSTCTIGILNSGDVTYVTPVDSTTHKPASKDAKFKLAEVNQTEQIGLCKDVTSAETIDVSNIDISGTVRLNYMFEGCSSLKSVTWGSSFNTSKIEEMLGMFKDCTSLENIDLRNFDTSSAKTLQEMFSGCTALKTVNVSSFDTSKVQGYYNMFNGCSSLTTIYASSTFAVASGVTDAPMFLGCTSLVGGKGTTCDGETWCWYRYARIDEGTENPGYFTEFTES